MIKSMANIYIELASKSIDELNQVVKQSESGLEKGESIIKESIAKNGEIGVFFSKIDDIGTPEKMVIFHPDFKMQAYFDRMIELGRYMAVCFNLLQTKHEPQKLF